MSHVDVSKSISWKRAAGLSLLYSSAYFVPQLTPTGAYLLPSGHLVSLVILPTLVAVVSLSAVICGAALAARRWFSPWAGTCAAVVGLALLTLIGIKGFLDAAGYDVESLVPHGQTLQTSLRNLKVFSCAILIALIWARRGSLSTLTRILSSVGFAFGVLALVRLVALSGILSGGAGIGFASAAPMSSFALQPRAIAAGVLNGVPAVGALPRRVVWVIFDETDFDRVYQSSSMLALLPNFARLSRASVFATDANSPASATYYSIPSLLTGVPITGTGVKLSSRGDLSLERTDGKLIAFDEATSVFGALAADGRTASVLGFYHPYCRLFSLQRCDTFTWPAVGNWDSALLANIPNTFIEKAFHRSWWETITKTCVGLLPGYLARDDDLTFVHLNVPHLPAPYADKVLNLPTSGDPLVEYSHNLRLADRILGQIIQELEAQASRHDLLLVVSTDHWLRKRWYDASEKEASRPVPLIMWKVGDSNGIVLSEPLSTVNTGAMILDFLRGQLSTQSDIAKWWENQPVHPSYVAPNS